MNFMKYLVKISLLFGCIMMIGCNKESKYAFSCIQFDNNANYKLIEIAKRVSTSFQLEMQDMENQLTNNQKQYGKKLIIVKDSNNKFYFVFRGELDSVNDVCAYDESDGDETQKLSDIIKFIKKDLMDNNVKFNMPPTGYKK